MHEPGDEALRAALPCFPLDGELVEVRPLRRGHIHDTFVSRWRQDGVERQYIHQRMNQAVFPDLDLLMGNIQRVSAHLVDKLHRNGSDGFEPLRLDHTRSGESFARRPDAASRTFVFIENTSSVDRCHSVAPGLGGGARHRLVPGPVARPAGGRGWERPCRASSARPTATSSSRGRSRPPVRSAGARPRPRSPSPSSASG